MKDLVNIFAGNPLLAEKRSHVNPRALYNLLTDEAVKAKGGARILPVCDGKVLVNSCRSLEGKPEWSLSWQELDNFGTKVPISLSSSESGAENGEHSYDKVVYLGEKDGIPFLAIDVSSGQDGQGKGKDESLAGLFLSGGDNSKILAFVDIRTLMLASEWDSKHAMDDLSIAGHARAITEWHKAAQFCGRCGEKTVPIEAGERRQCSNLLCKQKSYPRMDPVVIMLVIDKERDRVVLGRQSRFQPRLWSCLAGFIEAGESLEEAVRRETFEEVGIEVGDIVYHSSQPWPVGPSSMSCQLMVGFWAYAKSFDIRVDTGELEDAQWHTRQQVRQALTHTDYSQQQEAAALKILQAASGERRRLDNNSSAGAGTALPPVFVPGPYAIAHHLIATWVNQSPEVVLSKV